MYVSLWVEEIVTSVRTEYLKWMISLKKEFQSCALKIKRNEFLKVAELDRVREKFHNLQSSRIWVRLIKGNTFLYLQEEPCLRSFLGRHVWYVPANIEEHFFATYHTKSCTNYSWRDISALCSNLNLFKTRSRYYQFNIKSALRVTIVSFSVLMPV
jgi:hypothetical protein